MASSDRGTWVSTTHDWTAEVDRAHLADVRSEPETFAPGGLLHLVLEVLAYADDEAESLGRRGRCRVTFHEDGSVSIADDGRGTDTRRDSTGEVVKKPVMATKDLRFFDDAEPALLPDGRPRRGASVVAALTSWLVHTNRRRDGSWTQRYEHGLPTTDLVPIEPTLETGTTVRFQVDPGLVARAQVEPADVRLLSDFRWLTVEIGRAAPVRRDC